MQHKELAVQEYSWYDVCDQIKNVHPELANVINDWDPGQKYKLYKATYHYGDSIFDANTLKLPIGLGTVPITSHAIPSSIKEALSYSTFPVGVILSKKVEVFFEHASMLIPFAVFGPGTPLGLLETLISSSPSYSGHVWSTNAGARTLFMLPKISEKQAHAKLQKEFGFIEEAPKQYSDHFSTFRAMTRCPYFLQKPWELEILFFGKEWFKKNDSNKGCLRFHTYLLNYFVQYSSMMHSKPSFDGLWHLFANELTKRKKRPRGELVNVLQYLVKIMSGMAPGYRPATRDDGDYAPITEIQRAYIDTYRVSNFPSIMIPDHFYLSKGKKPLYFSLKKSFIFDVNPKSKEKESLITEVLHLYSLCTDFLNFIKNDVAKIGLDNVSDMVLNTKLLYFYSQSYKSNIYNIFKSAELPDYNPDFISCITNRQLPFADSSSFVRGCIMLSKKDRM